jgi:hypothetical protein
VPECIRSVQLSSAIRDFVDLDHPGGKILELLAFS